MGVATEEDLATADRAVVFFTRFWQDRSADFRTTAVRRKVQRLAERALPLRKKEVAELDTFALGELFEALGSVQTAEDVRRVERLNPVLSHLTGVSFPLPSDPTRQQAANVATAWRDFAFERGADFATLDGPGRLAATVLQTRYFRFLASIPRAVRGDDPDGAARLARVLAAARASLPVALLGLALAVVTAGLVSRKLLRPPSEPATITVTLLVAALPLAALTTRAGALGPFGITLALGLGLGALLVLELEGVSRRPWRRTLSRAGILLPLTLAAELGADAALDRGLGSVTLRALHTGDLDTLMWIAALLSAVGCLGIALPDALSESERDAPEPSDVVPGRRRPFWFVLAGAICASFALAAALAPSPSSGLAVLARAAGTTLVTTLVTMACAGTVAVPLGLLAGGISRAASTLLSRAVEVTCALPQPLIACAAFAFGTVPGAGLLGVLRGIEVGHLLRLRMSEQRAAHDVEPPSLGRAPFSPYFRRVLPAAIGPTALLLALTSSWLAALEGAGAELDAPISASLGALAMRDGAIGVAALLLLGLLTGSLAWLARDVSPRAISQETPDGVVVLALKRRIDSVRPAKPKPET